MRAAVADVAVDVQGGRAGTTCSVGVAWGDADSDPQTLFAAADDALYEAKRRGRNCVVAEAEPLAV